MAGVVIDLCVQGMVARGFVCRLDQVRRRYLSFGSHWLAGVVFRVPGWVCEEVVVAWVIRRFVEKARWSLSWTRSPTMGRCRLGRLVPPTVWLVVGVPGRRGVVDLLKRPGSGGGSFPGVDRVMARPSPYPPELRRRAVRVVAEVGPGLPQ